jgi:hypothetical protein
MIAQKRRPSLIRLRIPVAFRIQRSMMLRSRIILIDSPFLASGTRPSSQLRLSPQLAQSNGGGNMQQTYSIDLWGNLSQTETMSLSGFV